MSEEEEDAWLPLATQFRKKKLPVIGRRSPIELRGDLLRGIDYLDNGVAEGASPTPLMYATNLSWELVSKHIGVLVEHGLVFKRAITDARYVYKLTEEGQKTLSCYNECMSRLAFTKSTAKVSVVQQRSSD